MTAEQKRTKQDPLGLLHMGQIITRIDGKLESNPLADDISLLATSYDNAMEAYSLLRDRYQLLKESNALLAEELAWLRDQCDDFAVERAELLRKITRSKNRDAGKD